MRSFLCLSILVSVLSGCASIAGKPQVGPQGEQLVWIKTVRIIGGDWQPDLNAASVGTQVAGYALSSPVQAGVVGALIGMGFGNVAAREGEGHIQAYYFSKPPSGLQPSFPMIYRKPWPGARDLQPNSWAILSSDEIGPILLPCGGCKPVEITN